ncbi:GDP-mannose 4,6-dehydratase [Microcoleus sp. EPA2]|uniref:NAD-dependent epimerase/dehydratase family protein n=1 Tax=Microcoleus sp. EPA2 TaxID=2841654 RepID=UPI00312B5179
MSKTTYVVIGSNCFTGCHIVDALLDDPDNKVIGVSRSPEYKDFFLPYKQRKNPDFTFHQINSVREFDLLIELLDATKPEVVINVAALSEVGLSNYSPVEYFDINTTAVVKLCDQLRSRDYLKSYVHISSAEIFGSCADKVTEETLFNPSTPYAVSKAAADMYLNTISKNFGFPAIIIRSTNVYGRHQQLFKIIPRTAIYLKMGKTIELHGGGTSVKSFIHVRDVVQGLLLALKQGNPGTYHFTVPSDRTIADIVGQVCAGMGYDFEKCVQVVGERLGQDSQYLLDCSRAERELCWQPQVSFEQGVQEVIEWVESNWSAIEQEPLVYIHKN